MKPSLKIASATGVLVLAGVLLIAGLRWQATDATPTAPPKPSTTIAVSESPTQQIPTAIEVAPWQTGDSLQAAAPAAPVLTPPAFPARPATSAGAAQLSLQQMDQQLAQNEAQAMIVLRQLDTAAATGSLPANVNIEAARANIQLALQAQRLGREMAMLMQQPNSPQRQSRMAQISDQMSSLRTQLHYDISNKAPAQAAPR